MDRLSWMKGFVKARRNWVGMMLPGVLLAGLVLLLLVPKVRQWYALEQEIGEMERRMEHVSQELSSLPPERLEQLARSDAADRKGLPDRDHFYSYLEHLRKMGRALGIDEITYFRGAVEGVDMEEILSRSNLNTLPISLDVDSHILYGIPMKIRFHAPYRVLYRFLKSIRDGDRLTDIQEVRVGKNSGPLTVEMKMELYYLTTGPEKHHAA